VYLIDTNIISDVVRNPDGAAEAALRKHVDATIGISLIVKGELLYGLTRNNNIKGRKRLDMLLEAIEVWPLDDDVAETYGRIRFGMEKAGVTIDANDMWIAAQSITLGATLVTNDRRFWSIPGLKLENWLLPQP